MAPPRPAPDPPARTRLCRAAARLAARQGIAAATAERIAAEANLPAAAFRAEFDDVEACFAALYRATSEELLASVDAATRDAADWRAELDAGFGAALRYLADDAVLARACVVETVELGTIAATWRDATLERLVARLDAVRRRTGSPVPRLGAELLVRGTHELISAEVARGGAERLPDLLPQLRFSWLAACPPTMGRPDRPEPEA